MKKKKLIIKLKLKKNKFHFDNKNYKFLSK